MRKKKSSSAARISLTVFCILVFLHCIRPASILANETAAEVAASGIQFKEEKHISIEAEDLYISTDKITVTYLFKNHSDKDIASLIAFPVPEYDYQPAAEGFQGPNFEDFTVEVDGKSVLYQREERALLNGIDYTQLLKDMSIPIKGYGEKNGRTFSDIFNSLSDNDRKTLRDRHLVEPYQTLFFPTWKISIKYYWPQVFPKYANVRIKHTYNPSNGYDYIQEKYYKAACISGETKQWLHSAKRITYIEYVKYILITANNWKQPIKTFHLTIDQPADTPERGEYRTSMCFDKPLIQTAKNRYEVTMQNYIPQNDITVYFFRH